MTRKYSDVILQHNKRDNSGKGIFQFNGLYAKIWVNLKVKDEEDDIGLKPDEIPETKPDYIKKILDKAKPWKINIL